MKFMHLILIYDNICEIIPKHFQNKSVYNDLFLDKWLKKLKLNTLRRSIKLNGKGSFQRTIYSS